MKQKKVLYCVLNWGIGHATRSAVVISKLLQQQFEVEIASDGEALKVLRRDFPHLAFYELPAYHIQYARHGHMFFTMLFQLNKISKSIKAEQAALNALCTSNAYTCIISDHRYGCYHPRVHSIFLSHQLQPRMFSGLAFLQALFNRLHRQQLKHFNSFWIPDLPDEQKLSGELSAFKSENLRYIGLLSRLPQQVKAVKRFKYIALLSGPEPQRKILEDKLRKQLMNLQQATLLIRGKAGEDTEIETNGLYSEVGYLEGKVLAQLLLGAELIIARPGYSTIMDLAALGKSAVFIPTPGQTEQQYLAKILKQKGIAHYVEQHNFDLKQALIQSANFTGFNITEDHNLLTEAIKQITT